MTVQPIPEGYHTITPYLLVDGAARAIDFYKTAFGAVEVMRLPMPGDRIGHAEIKIGNSHVMLADEFPDMGMQGPGALGGTPVGLLIYVDNVDEAFEQAVHAGAEVERPLQNQFYGDRSGTLIDPFGHRWTIATHIEDVPSDEIQRRMQALADSEGQTS